MQMVHMSLKPLSVSAGSLSIIYPQRPGRVSCIFLQPAFCGLHHYSVIDYSSVPLLAVDW